MAIVSISHLTIFMGVGLIIGIGFLSWLIVGSKNHLRY